MLKPIKKRKNDEPVQLPGQSKCESDDFNWKKAVILGGAMGWGYLKSSKLLSVKKAEIAMESINSLSVGLDAYF